MGLDIALAEALVHPAPRASTLITSFLAMPMGLLAAIPAMLTNWANYLFPWAFTTHLLYFYLLLCLWVCWLLFLPCWPIGLITSFLELPQPIYFAFTSCCANGPVSCNSCHVAHWGNYLLPWVSTAHLLYFYFLLCLWVCWLSFMPCWLNGLITYISFLSLLYFPIVGLLLLLGSLSKMGLNTGHIVYVTHYLLWVFNYLSGCLLRMIVTSL